MLDDDRWIPRATVLAEFTCDALFSIEPTVYIGPGTDFTPEQWAEMRVVVPPPSIAMVAPGYVTTAALAGRQAELIGYYERLIATAEEHGVDLGHPFPYFRTMPAIIAGGAIVTQFVWNDGVPETTDVLQALAQAAPSPHRAPIWDDGDQGWAIRVLTDASRIYLVEWDDDSDADPAGYALDLATLASQAAAALARLEVIHAELKRRFGRDYWSQGS